MPWVLLGRVVLFDAYSALVTAGGDHSTPSAKKKEGAAFFRIGWSRYLGYHCAGA